MVAHEHVANAGTTTTRTGSSATSTLRRAPITGGGGRAETSLMRAPSWSQR